MIKVKVEVYVNTDDPDVALATVNDYFQFGTPIVIGEAAHKIYGWEVEADDPYEMGYIRLQ